MKKQLKLAAVSLVLAVTATTSFAVGADFAGADISNTSALDIVGFTTLYITEINHIFGSNSADQNVALVGQEGNENIAYVSQTGTANFAAIVQTGATASVAFAVQTGATNRAVILQK